MSMRATADRLRASAEEVRTMAALLGTRIHWIFRSGQSIGPSGNAPIYR